MAVFAGIGARSHRGAGSAPPASCLPRTGRGCPRPCLRCCSSGDRSCPFPPDGGVASPRAGRREGIPGSEISSGRASFLGVRPDCSSGFWALPEPDNAQQIKCHIFIITNPCLSPGDKGLVVWAWSVGSPGRAGSWAPPLCRSPRPRAGASLTFLRKPGERLWAARASACSLPLSKRPFPVAQPPRHPLR